MTDKPILTAADLDESRDKAIYFCVTIGQCTASIRKHDEAHGIPTEALLAVMRGEAVIVPVEPTREMLVGKMLALNMWKGMLAASPWAPKS